MKSDLNDVKRIMEDVSDLAFDIMCLPGQLTLELFDLGRRIFSKKYRRQLELSEKVTKTCDEFQAKVEQALIDNGMDPKEAQGKAFSSRVSFEILVRTDPEKAMAKMKEIFNEKE